MSKKKSRDEWLDPAAPSEATGEAAAIASDLAYFHIPQLIEQLEALGVVTEWLEKPEDGAPRYVFSASNKSLARAVQFGYEIGICREQAKACLRELDTLTKGLKGADVSAKNRRKKMEDDEDRLLRYYAARVADGETSIDRIVAGVQMKRSTGRKHITRFDERIREEASRLKKNSPGITIPVLVGKLVERFDGSPGVTPETVHRALKPKRASAARGE
jgi:hypothetical protein